LELCVGKGTITIELTRTQRLTIKSPT